MRLCERLLAAANGHPAERLGRRRRRRGAAPGHFGKVFLADNGSTAVEIALKMALQAQAQRGQAQRTRFVALRERLPRRDGGRRSPSAISGSTRRRTARSVSRSQRLRGLPYRSGPHDPLLARRRRGLARDRARARRRRPSGWRRSSTSRCCRRPGGMLLYSPDLLRRLRAWADAHGVYLIADEIASGMGRLGAMLASHLAGPAALPDFAALSKGLTGGVLPLSAVLTTDAIYDLFDADYGDGRAFLHSNTYTGNALGVAVANAVLDVFAGDDMLGRVAAHGPRLRAALEAVAARAALSCATCAPAGWWPRSTSARADGSAADPEAAAPATRSTARRSGAARCCGRSATRCTSSRR